MCGLQQTSWSLRLATPVRYQRFLGTPRMRYRSTADRRRPKVDRQTTIDNVTAGLLRDFQPPGRQSPEVLGEGCPECPRSDRLLWSGWSVSGVTGTRRWSSTSPIRIAAKSDARISQATVATDTR